DQPAEPSVVVTVMALLPLLYSSTYSSSLPSAPRGRNSLMMMGAATVTLKEQVAVFVAASVAVLITVVVPMGKVEPEAWSLLTPTPAQLSDAVTLKLTTAPAPEVAGVVMSAGQVICGACVSLTVTMNMFVVVVPPPTGVPVTVTGVCPTLKNEPAAGLLGTTPQLPVKVGAR